MDGLYYEHTIPNVTRSDELGLPIQYSCDALLYGNIPPTSLEIEYFYDMVYPTNIGPDVAMQYVESGLLQEIARKYRLEPPDGTACTLAPKRNYDNDSGYEDESRYNDNNNNDSTNSNNNGGGIPTASEASLITESLEEENDYWMVNITSKPDDEINTMFDSEGTCQEANTTNIVTSRNDVVDTTTRICKTIAGKLTISVYGTPDNPRQIKQFISEHFEASTRGTFIDVELLGFEVAEEVAVNRDEIVTTSAINNDGTLQTVDEMQKNDDKVTPEGYIFCIGLALTALIFIFIIVKRVKRRRDNNNRRQQEQAEGALQELDGGSINRSHDSIEIDDEHGQPCVHAIPKQKKSSTCLTIDPAPQLSDIDHHDDGHEYFDNDDESSFDPYGDKIVGTAPPPPPERSSSSKSNNSTFANFCSLNGLITSSKNEKRGDTFDENDEISPTNSLGNEQRSQMFGVHGGVIDNEYNNANTNNTNTDNSNVVEPYTPTLDDRYTHAPDDRYTPPSDSNIRLSRLYNSSSPSPNDSDTEDSWAQTDASLGSIELRLQPLEAEV